MPLFVGVRFTKFYQMTLFGNVPNFNGKRFCIISGNSELIKSFGHTLLLYNLERNNVQCCRQGYCYSFRNSCDGVYSQDYEIWVKIMLLSVN